MPAGFESLGQPGPTYISSHSAEIILSEIRPIKLKVDALSSINVFLDELLWNILNASRSLTTEKLKGGLTKVLPTPIGKEALLEAEVELRAYWERTSASMPSSQNRPGDDERTFSLDVAFELLRLKCQAYSTLNDADEDPEAESRLYDRLISAGTPISPPKPGLVSPAALYLTAILESICEHVLANVGRVAARDSSRSIATVHDLYIALCEDDAIYSLFKTMKVYEQIETLSKPRRSRSFSRPSDKSTPPSAMRSDSSQDSRSRLSSDSSSTAHGHSNLGNAPAPSASRTSFEKSRALKIFTSHNRSSSDQNRAPIDQAEHQNGHKKSDSLLANGSRQTLVTPNDRAAVVSGEFDDEESMQDFDDLMRSGATMKVSLTPDRLRTMEVYNKERNRREKGAPHAPDAVKSAASDAAAEKSSLTPKRSHGNSRRPTLRHVDSIIEDDEENGLSPKANGHSQPESMLSRPPSNARVRSISTSDSFHSKPHAQGLNRKASLNVMSAHPMGPPVTPQRKERPVPKQLDISSGTPPRTRKVGKRRESMDLDDIMNGSEDDDDVAAETKTIPKTPKSAVSNITRDLIDFLSEGPPVIPTLPKTASVVSLETTKSVGRPSGLRRMVSKLTKVGSVEQLTGGRNKHTDDSARGSLSHRLPGASATTTSFSQQSLSSKRSYPNVIVATRPPRFPQNPVSPPSSPSPNSSDDVNSHTPASSYSRRTAPSRDASDLTSVASSLLSRKADFGETASTTSTAVEQSPMPSRNSVKQVSAIFIERERSEEDSSKSKSPIRALPTPPSSVFKEAASQEIKEPLSAPQVRTTVERPRSKGGRGTQASGDVLAPTVPKEADTLPSSEEVKELRRLLSRATSPDECRLLIDMLLLKCGFPLEEERRTTYHSPSPSPSIDTTPLMSQDSDLEQSLVELLLSGSGTDASSNATGKQVNISASEPSAASHTHNSAAARKLRREASEYLQAPASTFLRMQG